MQALIVPLRLILFQLLLVLLSVAVEALVIHHKLKLNRRTSIQYSLSINLFSNIVGWLVFFMTQPFLPSRLKYELLVYIFLNVLNQNNDFNFNALFLLVIMGIFFLVFLIELKGLDLLNALLKTSNLSQENLKKTSSHPLLRKRLKSALKNSHIGSASVILIANAVSHGCVLLILLVRLLISGR